MLAPERLEEVLASVIDRRQDHAARRREHIAELNSGRPRRAWPIWTTPR